jgi:hypothetical protein
MKYWIIMLALVASQAFAGVNDQAIKETEAEITRVSQAIAQMKQEGLHTGRFEMTLWRLNNKLQALKDLNG